MLTWWLPSCNTLFMLNSTEMKFQLLIKTKMLEDEDISRFKTLRCCINPVYKCLNASDCWHFNIYKQDKFHELSMKKVL